MPDKPCDPVIVAIATAVTNYVAAQEDTPPSAAQSAYAFSGRLQMMDARRHLSLRLLRHRPEGEQRKMTTLVRRGESYVGSTRNC
jgi:hypothetical protein